MGKASAGRRQRTRAEVAPDVSEIPAGAAGASSDREDASGSEPLPAAWKLLADRLSPRAAETLRVIHEASRRAQARVLPLLFEEKTLQAAARSAGVTVSEILAWAHEGDWIDEVAREAWARSGAGRPPARPVIELAAEREREVGRLLRHARGRVKISNGMIRLTRSFARFDLVMRLPVEYWPEIGRMKELASRPAPKSARATRPLSARRAIDVDLFLRGVGQPSLAWKRRKAPR